MKISLLMLLILMACLTSTLSSAEEPCLHYMGDPVILSGIVTNRTFYGPPNYGENPDTDSRETQGILVLSKPICVDKNPNGYDEAEKNQLEVTLVPNSKTNLKDYLGKQVTVHGKLFHAFTGHHHTPVLIEIISIEKTGDDQPNSAFKREDAKARCPLTFVDQTFQTEIIKIFYS